MPKNSPWESILSIGSLVLGGFAAYQGFKAAEQRANEFRAQQENAARQYALAQAATETQTKLVNEQIASLRSGLEQRQREFETTRDTYAKQAQYNQDQLNIARSSSEAQLAALRSSAAEQSSLMQGQLTAQREAQSAQLGIAREQLASYQAQAASMQEQALIARRTAEQQMTQQKASSAALLQQQKVASAIQQQQAGAAPVGSRVRQRAGTPAALRTSLEIQSPVAGLGAGAGTPNATGGLNV